MRALPFQIEAATRLGNLAYQPPPTQSRSSPPSRLVLARWFHKPTMFPLNGLPVELIDQVNHLRRHLYTPLHATQILGWCSPTVLQELRRASGALENRISPTSSIWRVARENVGFGIPLPPAAGSEEQLSRRIFAGGGCVVLTVLRLPLSFS